MNTRMNFSWLLSSLLLLAVFATHATLEHQTHPRCPAPTADGTGTCTDECEQIGKRCAIGQICCSNGCGRVCTDPVPRGRKHRIATTTADPCSIRTAYYCSYQAACACGTTSDTCPCPQCFYCSAGDVCFPIPSSNMAPYLNPTTVRCPADDACCAATHLCVIYGNGEPVCVPRDCGVGSCDSFHTCLMDPTIGVAVCTTAPTPTQAPTTTNATTADATTATIPQTPPPARCATTVCPQCTTCVENSAGVALCIAVLRVYPHTSCNCPGGYVGCSADPCQSATCPAHPDAICLYGDCGTCKAYFYDQHGNPYTDC